MTWQTWLLLSTLVVLTAAVGAMMWFAARVVASVLPLIRENTQRLQARNYELENEREELIRRCADLQGVPVDGSKPREHRSCTIDPNDGMRYFSDGEVQAPDGTVLIKPGESFPDFKAGDDVPERIKERFDRWGKRYQRDDAAQPPAEG